MLMVAVGNLMLSLGIAVCKRKDTMLQDHVVLGSTSCASKGFVNGTQVRHLSHCSEVVVDEI